MKYYNALTEEEIQRVCLAFPYGAMVSGFKQFSKDFSTLMPGHRPKSVSEDSGRNLLANNPHSNLTAKMIEGLLSGWVKAVSNTEKKQRGEGKSADLSLIYAFSRFNLPGCLDLYFRFSDEEMSKEHILALSAGVEALVTERELLSENSRSSVDRKKIEEIEAKYVKELQSLKAERKQQSARIKELLIDVNNANDQIKLLLESNRQIEQLQEQLTNATETISKTSEDNSSLVKQINELQALYKENQIALGEACAQKAEIQTKYALCQAELSELEEERKKLSVQTYQIGAEILRPVDMDEFNEYLSYNLTSIGIDTDKSFFQILRSFLADVLFRNQPIICNHAAGISLAACVSNSLCGNPHPLVIPYTKDISASVIRAILNSEHRVIVFDSFLANYNEMELLPILRSVTGKIIFLTVEYDKSITYLVPDEVLCNCTYFNANHIPELLQQCKIDEDPSTICEERIAPKFEKANTRMKRLCKEIMDELCFPPVVAELISSRMVSEQKLIETLAFTILPYAQEVNNISPYNKSPRLQIYAGHTGKCPNKALLMEWFGDE